MIGDITQLAKDLFSLRDRLRTARREKRDRLAQYLSQMAVSLEDAHADLRAGGSAARACGALHQYVDLVPSAVDEALGPERTEQLRRSSRQL